MALHQNCGITRIVIGWLAALPLTVGVSSGQENGLTFFGWSDQHVQTDGNGAHLIPAIDAMNSLAGKAYPDAIGGRGREAGFCLRTRGHHRVAHAGREEHL